MRMMGRWMFVLSMFCTEIKMHASESPRRVDFMRRQGRLVKGSNRYEDRRPRNSSGILSDNME